MALKLYPIGIQTFSRIRKEDKLYVDKTAYVYHMTHSSGTFFILSRPRRFGKSLLVSTFKSYFEGKKELFKGLAIEKLEKEWTKYPVLHFSMAVLIRKRDMNGALQLLQDFLGTVPYCNVKNYEGHYQQMLFIIFSLLTNLLVDVEVHTPKGRVDIVLLTRTDLYVIELKLNKNAEAAMRQIDLKNYRQRFALCGRPVTKVGINFDSTTGNITDWAIEQ